jgi:hypothetical protein
MAISVINYKGENGTTERETGSFRIILLQISMTHPQSSFGLTETFLVKTACSRCRALTWATEEHVGTLDTLQYVALHS